MLFASLHHQIDTRRVSFGVSHDLDRCVWCQPADGGPAAFLPGVSGGQSDSEVSAVQTKRSRLTYSCVHSALSSHSSAQSHQ